MRAWLALGTLRLRIVIHIRRRHLCVCLCTRVEFPTFKQFKNKAYSVAFPPCSWHGRGRRGLPNRLQNYKFLLTLAQKLAEICQKKLQIANFSAGNVRKWWVNLKFREFFLSLHRVIDFSRLPKQERWNQVEPRCAERWHGCGNAEMMSNSTLPLGFLHLGYSWSRVGQLLYFAIFG